MLREMDHSSLPLDAQCRAAKEELGKRVRMDLSSLSDLPRTAGHWFPHTGLPERRKCTTSNGIRACRRNTVRRTSRSDQTVGGQVAVAIRNTCKP